MHSIVVKDQYSYEQPDWFIKFVFSTTSPVVIA